MARAIYAVLGLALTSLVAGFFVRSTSVPLVVSIALSIVVSILILAGWSRRLRESDEFRAATEPPAVEDVDAARASGEASDEQVPARRARGGAKPVSLGPRPVGESTREMPVTRIPRHRPRPPAKAKAKTKTTAKAKAKPKVVGRTGAAKGRRVLVIPGRSRYHVAGCRFVTGGDVRRVSEATARSRGYTACTVCLASSE